MLERFKMSMMKIGAKFQKLNYKIKIIKEKSPRAGDIVSRAESTLNYPGLQVSPPVHENQLSKSNKLDAEAIWL
jgi:hypothetical protein